MTDITYDDVFAALLSMDVYNRTTNQGVFIDPSDSVADTADERVGNEYGDMMRIKSIDTHIQ
jgi:hypothetical protein